MKNKKGLDIPPYIISFRVVRFKLSDSSFETVLTNLDFPPDELKQLYAMRWGIETSFRELKYTIGLSHFHAKRPDFILQEIFARLTMYNFSELISMSVVIERSGTKYAYRATFFLEELLQPIWRCSLPDLFLLYAQAGHRLDIRRLNILSASFTDCHNLFKNFLYYKPFADVSFAALSCPFSVPSRGSYQCFPSTLPQFLALTC